MCIRDSYPHVEPCQLRKWIRALTGSGGGVLGWRAARQQARPRAGLLGRSRAPPKPRGMSILSRADFL